MSVYFFHGPICVVIWTQTTLYTLQLNHFCNRYINENTNFLSSLLVNYSYLNICDFKATHKQVIFQDLRFSHWCWYRYISARMWCHFYHSVVTYIWEELTASNNSNCLPSNTAFLLKDTNLIVIFCPSYYISCDNTFLFIYLFVTKAMHFLTVTLLWHTANFTSPHTVKHIEFKCLCYLLTSCIWK
jgi:hypothetical protein